MDANSRDMGAAMAGISFMVRSTEDRMFERLQTLQQTLQQDTTHQVQQLQQQIQQLMLLVSSQKASLEQQT